MDNNSVFRAAFIVETVAVRVSNKSKKKFAILTIGDEGERFELPIWPDLYETHSALLEENQILYAVLQIEEKEGERKLSCRWLGDMTKANDMMVRECDDAYDRAKLMVRRFSQNKDRKEEKDKEASKQSNKRDIKVEKKPELVELPIDLMKVKLGQILELKELLSNEKGENQVSLKFFMEDRHYATLQLDKMYATGDVTDLQKRVNDILSIA